MLYATIVPAENAEAPRNTGHSWAFQFDSRWIEIGAGKVFTEEEAEHARRWFTVKPADGGEPTCRVVIEYHEGEVKLQPTAPQQFPCMLEGCAEVFADFGVFSTHVKECALKTPDERAGANSDVPDGFPCPADGCGFQGKTASGLDTHVRTKHGGGA